MGAARTLGWWAVGKIQGSIQEEVKLGRLVQQKAILACPSSKPVVIVGSIIAQTL
jgi:hypothetical protein